jgi:hypothetical protein
MSEANPLWGAARLHGELLKLGIAIGQASVAKYMVRCRWPPSQTWRKVLTTHKHQLMAADFVIPTVTYQLLFLLVLVAYDRRQIVHLAVTAQPASIRVLFNANEKPA